MFGFWFGEAVRVEKPFTPSATRQGFTLPQTGRSAAK